MNLIYPAIITHLITIGLFISSKKHDQYLLLMMLIGQLFFIGGEINKNVKAIEISHIFFTLSIVIGPFYFKENKNLYFVGLSILVRFITYFIYEDCLFDIIGDHYEFNFVTKLNQYINWHLVYLVSSLVIIYRLYIQ
tara:strand:+ start:5174 stop:5584 length:411 start_codon:yes stop_codon:yes gene_type:complete